TEHYAVPDSFFLCFCPAMKTKAEHLRSWFECSNQIQLEANCGPGYLLAAVASSGAHTYVSCDLPGLHSGSMPCALLSPPSCIWSSSTLDSNSAGAPAGFFSSVWGRFFCWTDTSSVGCPGPGALSGHGNC